MSDLSGFSEAPHVCRGLQLLSRMSHYKQDDEQICSRGSGKRDPHGVGSRTRLPFPLGDCGLESREDWLRAVHSA